MSFDKGIEYDTTVAEKELEIAPKPGIYLLFVVNVNIDVYITVQTIQLYFIQKIMKYQLLIFIVLRSIINLN